MEAAPPTYEKATVVNVWDLVARYVPSNDLCSAALVCSQWHMTFVPHLWGNPAAHFAPGNDRIYVALTKFKRTLDFARLLVRSVTHTLHLPPAHAEIYNGPHSNWLRDVLERLPNLQTLIVRGLPFFDHAALQALRTTRLKPKPASPPAYALELPGSEALGPAQPPETMSSFGLRLLDASRCSNMTASGLAQALGRFPALMYLDLSFTYSAKDVAVVTRLRRLSGLQVLKLRGVGLTDEGVDALASAIGLRVRSLDVRDNRITDRGVRSLIEQCFAGEDVIPSGGRSPSLLPYLGTEMLDIYQGEDFEGFLRQSFTKSFVSRLAIEDVPEGGITHLYISGNQITVEAASGLIHSQRLHVFDLGNVAASLIGQAPFSGRAMNGADMEMPGVEKLTPMFAEYASDALRFLRINHAVTTKDAPDSHPDEVVLGRAELGDTSLPPMPNGAVELPCNLAPRETHEMPAVTTPKYELPGDPVRFVVSPAISDPQHLAPEETEPPRIRRGSADAPEVAVAPYTSQEIEVPLSPLSPTFDGTFSNADSIISPPMSPTGTLSPMSFSHPLSPTFVTGSQPPQQADPGASSSSRPRTYSSVVVERKARLSAHINHCRSLHPAMLPHLSTLMLTDVPPFTDDVGVTDRLIRFIKHCAEEAKLARHQALMDYALPPGRRGHASAVRQSAAKIFALKRLVLELAPEEAARRASRASPWQHADTRSMTEDRDSEALWSAAETDFSFFGDSDDNDFPSLDRGRYAHNFIPDEKQTIHGNGFMPPSPVQTEPVPHRIDVVAELASFRKDRRDAHQRATKGTNAHVDTEGYWDGVVQIVRPGGSVRVDDELDYYGNVFSSS